VPRGTSKEITALLNNEINSILDDPRLKIRLADLGLTPMPLTPAQCQKFIATEVEKWAKVVKFAGIKPE
jgi:tripartite-type tricarboxylate transporter receptor subunit TctC